ncbi:M23 family metallopeptidase [Aquibacillus koreensis]|uniref:M23 family metallopeptidase n=1 Tax=Aquibacillus koreensis TaxID=279446 RepID=A0A9X4AHQ9_9BACI|nr:M23 family metallopeptidase [Aquibacillus koreensis]MCT2535911.1 M23 family metallopeptidase [Aquibacillus koreensis]MDC3420367.1 M23 family metallopeptidase [Aquibacillus koreensis]
MKKLIPIMIYAVFFLFLLPPFIYAEEDEQKVDQEKMALYKKTAAITQIPWYYLAAIDQFEENTQKETASDDLIAITIDQNRWFGIGNSIHNTSIAWVSLFSGFGQDGNGDNLADPTNDEDILYSMAHYIEKEGTSHRDIKIALWNYYKRDLSVQTIMNIAKVYKQFGTISLNKTDFPIPLQHNYSYKNTWGDARGFGGRRIHEGTDIFANYGVPVKSTTYGVVELKGWNRYGGWRIGIRDIYNRYHYYAHLNGYKDGLKVGDVVEPGDIIGSVGSTGYGPPGTAGKFPPHLHYGMYKDNGYSEWSFDPYPYLRKWERAARNR